MPNYEITISVHVPDDLVTLAKRFEQTGDCCSHSYKTALPGEDGPTSDPATLAQPQSIQESKPSDPPQSPGVKDHDFEEVKKVAIACQQRCEDGTVPAILAKLGVKKLSELGEEQYAKAYTLFAEAK